MNFDWFDGFDSIIVDATADFLVELAPVALLLGGLALAFGVIDRIIDIFSDHDKFNKTNDDY